MNVDISIIIVNYNAFDYLMKCLKSIELNSEGIKYEIILVDNNSKEGDIKEVIKDYSNIKLILNEDNYGFAKANNQGLELSNGKYVLFLNNDTQLTENSLKKVFDFAENWEDEIILGCQLLNADGSKQESIVKFPSLWNSFTENFFLYKLFPKSKLFNKYYLNFRNLTKPEYVDVVKGAFMFSKRKVFERLQGFDTRFFFYSEETDLCYRFKRSFDGEIIFLPNVKTFHFGGIMTNNDNWFLFKNLSIGKIQYYQKHFRNIKYLSALLFHYAGIFLRVVYYFIIGLSLFKSGFFKKSYMFCRLLFIYPENKFK